MLQNGQAQGFHIDYFFKGHGPTDFERWARETSQETAAGAEVLTPGFPSNPPFLAICATKILNTVFQEGFRDSK